MTGARLGSQYLLEERIGEGGLGVVWRASDVNTGAAYAIKVLKSEYAKDPRTVARFVQERNTLMRFEHPNVVRLHDMVVEQDRLALVMDYVTDGDLDALRQRAGGAFPSAMAAALVAQVSDALAAAHAAGIVHRDLKPANVLVDGDQVRLTDFGIARVTGEASLTTTGFIVGTIAYMAPEALVGAEPGPACDVYAAGITLFELLTGQRPFSGPPAAVMYAHVNTLPSRPAGVPDELWTVLAACMAKEPQQRPSAAELAAVLHGFAGTADPVGMAGTADPAVAAPGPALLSGWDGQPPGWDGGQPVASQPATPAEDEAADRGLQTANVARGWHPQTSGVPVRGLSGADGRPAAPEPAPATGLSPAAASTRKPWKRGSRMLAGVGGGLVVLAVAITATMLHSQGNPAAAAPGTQVTAGLVTGAGGGPSPATSGAHGRGTPAASAGAGSATAQPGTQSGGPAEQGSTGPGQGTDDPQPRESAPAPSASSPAPPDKPVPAPSSTAPVNTAWKCGPSAPATLYTSGEDTGQTLKACIRVFHGRLQIRGTLTGVVTSWSEQVKLVLKDTGQQNHGQYVSAVCTVSDCDFTMSVTPPSRGQWTVIPEWERGGNYQSTGREPGFVKF